MRRGRSVVGRIPILAMLGLVAAIVLGTPASAAAQTVFSDGAGVQTNPHVYAIFWGSNWNSTGERGRLETLYSELSNSSWEGTLTQYWGSETSSVGAPQGFVSHQVGFSAYLDSSVAAPSGLNHATMQSEIAAVAKAAGWPQGPSVDNQFVILTPPGTTYNMGTSGYCGFHSWTGTATYPERAYVFVPWGGSESSNPFKNCIMTVTAAHEFAEAATDPYGESWGGGQEGSEIADRCGDQPKGELPGGIVVPSIWDESSSKCTLGNSNPPQIGPEIAPLEPANLLQTSATLAAKTTSNGVSMNDYSFQWGQTTSYGNTTPVESFFSYSTAPISGLSPNTTYHFRLVLSTASGATVKSPDRQFTTLEYPPENTAPPTIAATPHIGTALTTTNGSWTHSPSYKYAWQRCKTIGGAECTLVGSQASYTPLDADAGYTLAASVTAFNSGGSVTVSSKPTARVPTQHWYACKNVGEGAGSYSDAACLKEGGGKAYAWAKLSSTATALSMSGLPGKTPVKGFATNPPFIMSWAVAGVKLAIACSSSTATGQVQNPSAQNPGGGVAGTAVNTKLVLKGCVFAEAESLGCKVRGGAISTNALSAVATELKERPAIRFEPQSGGSFFTILVEQCNAPLFNGAFTLSGHFTGVVNAESAFEFDESGSALSFGGPKTTFAGASKLSTSTGEALKVSP